MFANPKEGAPRGHRMSLHAMSFGNRAVNGHGTVTTITTQHGKDVSRGSSEEPLAPCYPGKIGKTFYVETEEERIGEGDDGRGGLPRSMEGAFYGGGRGR